MDRMNETQTRQYLNKIRALEFVKEARLASAVSSSDEGADGILKIRTTKGSHVFRIETKSSYLDRSILNAIISHANASSKAGRHPLLLLARYVPQPSAARLIEAGINFVDLAGNMHLALNNDYVRTVLGSKETRGHSDRILTPSRIQLLFAFAAQPESANWTVRQLSDLSGISKSNVAKLRQQLLAEGLLEPSNGGLAVRDTKELEQQILRGYAQVLRPKIVIGQYRAHESMQKVLLEKFNGAFKESSVNWSLSGGPAAYLLQRFYEGTEVPVFVNMLPDNAQRELRVLPDKTGPIIFMHSFGRLTHWKNIGGTEIAHPWLIFAELMQSQDPRAHEAAVQLKNEFLSAA
jgi:hypothetical protein